jgi:hypothetical protein
VKAEALADLLVAAVDHFRSTGDEKLASQLEAAAPLVGAFVATNEEKERRGRACFIADLASRMLGGSVEVALDAEENIAPKVRRAVELAALVLHEAERAAGMPSGWP